MMPDPWTPGLHNPEWKGRNENWGYEQDWDSPIWRFHLRVLDRLAGQRREQYGFTQCPRCQTWHTRRTLRCRECEYLVENIPEQGRRIERWQDAFRYRDEVGL